MSKVQNLRVVDWQQLADDLSYQAEWRREKASEYPHDSKRNIEAAHSLERIRDGLNALPAELKREFERFARDPETCASLCEEWDLQVGMILPPADAEALVKAILRRVG